MHIEKSLPKWKNLSASTQVLPSKYTIKNFIFLTARKIVISLVHPSKYFIKKISSDIRSIRNVLNIK